jgi:hypothetical protein
MSASGHKRSLAHLLGTSALNLEPDLIAAKTGLAAPMSVLEYDRTSISRAQTSAQCHKPTSEILSGSSLTDLTGSPDTLSPSLTESPVPSCGPHGPALHVRIEFRSQRASGRDPLPKSASREGLRRSWPPMWSAIVG